MSLSLVVANPFQFLMRDLGDEFSSNAHGEFGYPPHIAHGRLYSI